MNLPNFVGASYRAVAKEVNCEDLINMQPELQSVPAAKAPVILVGSPGTTLNMTVGAGPIRGALDTEGYTDVISGAEYYRVDPAGVATLVGAVANDGQPVKIVASTSQVAICSAGNIYVSDGAGFALIAGPWTSAVDVEFSNGYFIVLDDDGLPVGGQFFISAFNDARTWDPLDFSNAPFSNNKLRAIIVDHDDLFVFGSVVTQPFIYNASAEFPFQLNRTAVMNQGILAKNTRVKLDNTTFWIGRNENGGPRAFLADGYRPQGISAPEIEQFWFGYTNPDDATAWTYELNGRAIFHVNFNTAQKSWRFDRSTNLWHRVAWRHPVSGVDECHRGNCHAVRLGKHIIGDRQTGQLWELSPTVYADGAYPLVAERIAPAPFQGNKMVFYPVFELITQVGIGDGSNQDPNNGTVTPEANPVWMLSWSNDNGYNFGTEYALHAGAQGEYETRLRKVGCGAGRNRVFKVKMSAAAPRVIIGAELPEGVTVGIS